MIFLYNTRGKVMHHKNGTDKIQTILIGDGFLSSKDWKDYGRSNIWNGLLEAYGYVEFKGA